jgi:hypothetical protein
VDKIPDPLLLWLGVVLILTKAATMLDGCIKMITASFLGAYTQKVILHL